MLNKGKINLIGMLINDKTPKAYISHVIWGNGGTENGKKKVVKEDRNSLFGVTKVSKPIVVIRDEKDPSKIVISCVLEKNEGNDSVLNEMALKMSNGDLFAMETFQDVTKTDKDKLIWQWDLYF